MLCKVYNSKCLKTCICYSLWIVYRLNMHLDVFTCKRWIITFDTFPLFSFFVKSIDMPPKALITDFCIGAFVTIKRLHMIVRSVNVSLYIYIYIILCLFPYSLSLVICNMLRKCAIATNIMSIVICHMSLVRPIAQYDRFFKCQLSRVMCHLLRRCNMCVLRLAPRYNK